MTCIPWPGELVRFFTSGWQAATALVLTTGEKAVDVPPAGASRLELHIQNRHPEANRYCQRLHEAAETWRNPYGHGGFDKQHGTLAFFIPGIGPFPLLLSDIRKHPSFSVVPEREESFDELCAVFDELDRWLRTSQVAPAIRWADECFDIAFTEEFLARFRQAVANGPEAFDAYLTTTSYRDDQARNMEWE